MVPSYASSIGSSGDRPVALAELVGILVNDGVRRPGTALTMIHFAPGTPYETVLERNPPKGEVVLNPVVARAARKAMANVVAQGTARRLHGAFKYPDGKLITVGEKPAPATTAFKPSTGKAVSLLPAPPTVRRLSFFTSTRVSTVSLRPTFRAGS